MDAAAILDILRDAVPDAAVQEAPSVDMPAIMVDREHLLDVFRVLRDHPALQFAFLADVTAADYLPAALRFEVVYHLGCLGAAYPVGPPIAPARLRVKVRVPGADPRVPSVVSLYPAAGWAEREVFDLFGIAFDGNPDLRRILMPDDWEGYPLRKDYPVQIRKDTESSLPLQISPEEFARSIRAQQEQSARRQAGKPESSDGE